MTRNMRVELPGRGKEDQSRPRPWRLAAHMVKPGGEEPRCPVSNSESRPVPQGGCFPHSGKRSGGHGTWSCLSSKLPPCGWSASPSTDAHFSAVFGPNIKKSPDGGWFTPIWPKGDLAFLGRFAIIQVTHSPCLSRHAVTHIKGEFFYCAPPGSHAEEPR